MIIYINEEGAYLSWLARHRNGYVLEALRRPTHKPPLLHAAMCDTIRKSASKKTHWTSGRRLKACSLEVEELVAWANDEYGAPPARCEQCHPGAPAPADPAPGEGSHEHLTRLGREILDYVVESAVIHLDQGDSKYDLTVGDVAQCVHKTPAQITAAVLRLHEDGFLRLEGDLPAGASLNARRRLYPTADSLRMLPAFELLPREEIEAELERLTKRT